MPALDQFNRMMFDTSNRQWLLLNRGRVQYYLDRNVYKGIAMQEHMAQWSHFLNKRPYLGRSVVSDYFIDNHIKVEKVLKLLKDTPGALSLILGQVGKGKTALGLHLLEELHKRHGLSVGMIHTELKGLPAYIKQGRNVFNLDTDTVWFLDEASLHANARNAMTKDAKELSMLMNIRRHQNLTLLFASQHHGFIDINIMRAAHFFFFKPLSWEEQTKRGTTSSFDYLLEFISWMMPRTVSQTLFTDGIDWMKFDNPLPSFWTEEISKSYGKWTLEDVVIFVKEAMDEGMRFPAIESQLAIRGFRWVTRAEIRRAYEDPNGFIEDAKGAGYN